MVYNAYNQTEPHPTPITSQAEGDAEQSVESQKVTEKLHESHHPSFYCPHSKWLSPRQS